MRSLIITSILCVAFLSVSAQKIHSVKEILQIMDSSEYTYLIDNKEVMPIDYSQIVLTNDFYKKLDGNSQTISQYEPNDSAVFYMEIAESFYNQSDMDQAREYYFKTLKADSTYYKALVYLGDTYYHQRRFSEALTYYQKAIESNYIDYFAHWACANAYLYLGYPDMALKEITIAKILNRNNPRLTTRLMDIYKMNKKNYTDWYFSPIYSVEEDYDKEGDRLVVKIAFKDYWMSYALAKAVWKYEPGYAAAMGNDFILGEKEALNAYLHAADIYKSAKKAIATKVLYSAIEKHHIDAYVFYETVLPSNPQMAMYLDKEGIETIASYILDVRSQIKK